MSPEMGIDQRRQMKMQRNREKLESLGLLEFGNRGPNPRKRKAPMVPAVDEAPIEEVAARLVTEVPSFGSLEEILDRYPHRQDQIQQLMVYLSRGAATAVWVTGLSGTGKSCVVYDVVRYLVPEPVFVRNPTTVSDLVQCVWRQVHSASSASPIPQKRTTSRNPRRRQNPSRVAKQESDDETEDDKKSSGRTKGLSYDSGCLSALHAMARNLPTGQQYTIVVDGCPDYLPASRESQDPSVAVWTQLMMLPEVFPNVSVVGITNRVAYSPIRT